jgi:hypothetical protein
MSQSENPNLANMPLPFLLPFPDGDHRNGIILGTVAVRAPFTRWGYVQDYTRRGLLPPEAEAFLRTHNASTGQTVHIKAPCITETVVNGVKQAVNFSFAAVKHLLSGAQSTQETEYESRMAICRACEKFDAESTKCRQCGCRLDIKAAWQETSCPLGRW